MSNSDRPKYTVPGFGPPPRDIKPLEVVPLEGPEASMGGLPAEVVQPPVRMHIEPTPHEPDVRHAHGAFPADARRRGTPAVDIDLVHERRSAPLPDQPWIFLEVWTRNTVYQLDASLVCVEVIDQGTRKPIGEHPLRGARLVGGQSRDGEAMELSHPFPRPGSEAVFEQASGRHVRFSQTSTVTRVVMRLRVLTVEPEQLLPTWEDVSGKWDTKAVESLRKKEKK